MRVNLSTDPNLKIKCSKCGCISLVKDVMPENPIAEFEGYCRKCGGLNFFEDNEDGEKKSYTNQFISLLTKGIMKGFIK